MFYCCVSNCAQEEAVEQKRVEEARRRRRRKAKPSQWQRRVEVWISPDGSSSRDQQSDRDSDHEDLSSLPSSEVGNFVFGSGGV